MAYVEENAKFETKTAVILANTGTPDSPERADVKKYLGEFLMDPRICPMNRVFWWMLLHMHILPRRSRRSAEKYRLIWTAEGSPLNVTQDRLAARMTTHYRQAGYPVTVRSAMSYGQPSMESVMRGFQAEGYGRLIVLPLYPQSAYSTKGSVSDIVERAAKKVKWSEPYTIIDNYHDDPLYAKAVAASILNAGFDPDSNDRLLFSYHSIPLADIEAGDTYELQVGASSLAIANEMGLDRKRWTIGYQCRFDKGRTWLSPFTRRILAGWADADMPERVFIVCPNFAIDCLETLYDVEREIKPEYLLAKRAVRAAGTDAGAQDNAGRGAACGNGARNHSEAPHGLHGHHSTGNFEGSQRGIDVDWNPAVLGDELVYVPCLNASMAHVKVLAHVLEPYLAESEDA